MIIIDALDRFLTLDTLRKQLMYIGYEELKLKNLKPLQDEIAEELKKAGAEYDKTLKKLDEF